MAPDKSYVTRDDGMFRSFDRACKRAIDSGDHKNDGPTTTQLAGALMGRPSFNEEKLGKNWKIFAATYPTHATIIRRGAAELRASANEPLKPDLPAGARTATKYLLISKDVPTSIGWVDHILHSGPINNIIRWMGPSNREC